MKCYWITFKSSQGETWDEGVPYVATSEDDAERQMIINGCGGREDASLDELRQYYRRYHEREDSEPLDYSITEAEGWEPDESGFPVEIAAERRRSEAEREVYGTTD